MTVDDDVTGAKANRTKASRTKANGTDTNRTDMNAAADLSSENSRTGETDQTRETDQVSHRGRITRVAGRNTVTGGRGLPKVSEIVMTHEDGRVIEAGLLAHQSPPNGTATLVRAIDAGEFPVCPICLEEPADTKEHVPPRPLGGVVMTYTCNRCNGGLGSRAESSMQEWFDGSFEISYTRDGDPTHFGHNRALFRTTSNGEFVLLHEKGSDVLAGAFRQGGTVTSHQRWPHPNQYKTGLLKNAYLAACLSLRAVPDVPSAHEIRAELLAARDAKSRADVQMGERARALRAYRTGAVASGPPLALVYAERNPDVDAEPTAEHSTGGSSDAEAGGGPGEGAGGDYLLSLAGTLLVSWPFPEVPAHAQAVQVTVPEAEKP